MLIITSNEQSSKKIYNSFCIETDSVLLKRSLISKNDFRNVNPNCQGVLKNKEIFKIGYDLLICQKFFIRFY